MKKMFPVMMDLHNHTVFSDGVHTIDDLVGNAIKYDIKILGISDHYELIEDLEEYLNILYKKVNQFESEIRILKGIEIDVSTLLSISEENKIILKGFDYVLIENVEYYSNQNKLYNRIKELLENYNYKFGIAHINLDKMIKQFKIDGLINFFSFIEENEIFWEINTNCYDEFYNLFFNDQYWMLMIDKLTNYDIEISVGSDTHLIEENYYHRVLRGNQLAEKISFK